MAELQFIPVEEKENLEEFRKLLICLFPVPYPKSFFNDIIAGKIFAFLVRSNSEVVGCLSWRVLNSERGEIELLNFGVLVLHRRKGIGGKMLDFVLQKSSAKAVKLYVQTSNEDAIKFYENNCFKIVGTEDHYYPRLSPPSAHLLTLEID